MNHTIKVREAISEDIQFISELMESTLNSFYSEDHKEKAIKILEAHINKTDKNFGLLTLEQKIFIITKDDLPIGLVDVVRKRQNTFKISPIIIIPEFRNRGFGSFLFNHVEEYVKTRGARQIFCTVSQESKRTLNFFLKHGFNIAAECLDYQKKGVIEFLLYKDFEFIKEFRIDLKEFQITIAEEKDKSKVKSAFTKYFSDYISLIDDQLFEKLFRSNNNQKSNEVFISASKGNEIVGLAVASKKKSGIIKVLPIIHQSQEVFSQFIQFLPKAFQSKGYRKIYLQTFTNSNNIIILQKFQWNLEGILPNSYKENTITLLWTKELI